MAFMRDCCTAWGDTALLLGQLVYLQGTQQPCLHGRLTETLAMAAEQIEGHLTFQS